MPTHGAALPAGNASTLRSLATTLVETLLPAAAQAADKDPTPPPAAPPVRVRIKTTAGAFTIQVNVARAPLTAANFLQYAHDGFYEGTIIHRIVEGFLIQGGGFLPDYSLKPTRPSIPNESGNGLSNVRGTVGLARSDDPYSGNSQFFINLADNAMLDPQATRWGYTVFGTVVEGMESLEQMSHVATGTGDGKAGPLTNSVPIKQIVIQKVEVLP